MNSPNSAQQGSVDHSVAAHDPASHVTELHCVLVSRNDLLKLTLESMLATSSIPSFPSLTHMPKDVSNIASCIFIDESTVSLSEAASWRFQTTDDPHNWHGPALAIFTDKSPQAYPSLANAAFFTYPIDVPSLLEFTENLPRPGAVSRAEVDGA
ncbi:hypothetical protein [Corynebacterium kozikiae]|uniref:hypothetical protein n=1 Tax=Corynebacterium kozikiae TaxID=2968469 RepID=UPI00211BF19D|nr:hypothetical protein [Corynebacterium sp. 76QC2CO]MCQ9344118.1 hypothetical protein [Corynebacterium sp. 76QC2CO]